MAPDLSHAGSNRDRQPSIQIDLTQQITDALADYTTTTDLAATYLTAADAATTYATPSDITSEVASALPDGSAAGDMLVWNGTAWTTVANGTGTLHNDGSGNLSWS